MEGEPVFDAAFSRGWQGFWRAPREVGRTAEDIQRRRALAEEGRRIEDAFFFSARELFLREAGTEALAAELLEQWADTYECDPAHQEIVDRMILLVQCPSIRRETELKPSTRVRMEMWGLVRQYVDWRRRWGRQEGGLTRKNRE